MQLGCWNTQHVWKSSQFSPPTMESRVQSQVTGLVMLPTDPFAGPIPAAFKIFWKMLTYMRLSDLSKFVLTLCQTYPTRQKLTLSSFSSLAHSPIMVEKQQSHCMESGNRGCWLQAAAQVHCSTVQSKSLAGNGAMHYGWVLPPQHNQYSSALATQGACLPSDSVKMTINANLTVWLN